MPFVHGEEPDTFISIHEWQVNLSQAEIYMFLPRSKHVMYSILSQMAICLHNNPNYYAVQA